MKEFIISINDSAFLNNETGEEVFRAESVIELVRCENCKYGIENGELCGRKVYLCSAMTNPNEFYGDFYCESGERKDNDT